MEKPWGSKWVEGIGWIMLINTLSQLIQVKYLGYENPQLIMMLLELTPDGFTTI